MRRFRWVALALISLALAGATSALAEKRIALLIGNKDYKPGVGALVNPLNDVRVMGEALKAVGFEVLKPAQNAKRADMLIAIHDFASRLKSAGADAVGFLYYSGHGIASAGENYLVPVDIDEPSTLLLSVQGVKQSEVLAILRNEAPNAAHYLVLDACRNTLQGTRGGKGFLPVGQQSGVLVAFAAEPGKTASDTGVGSGPYAAALAAELVKPGQSDLIMFHHVRVAVIDKTNGDQVPWTEDGIQRRERVLFGGEAKPSEATAPARLSEAAEAWDRAKDTTNVAVLEGFIARYKDTFFAQLARSRIDELKNVTVVPKVAVTVEPRPPIEPPNPKVAPIGPPNPRPPMTHGGMEVSPFKGFSVSPERVDVTLQATPMWRVLKLDYPEWYADRLKEIGALAADKKDDLAIAQQLARALVTLRRQNGGVALAAGFPQLKAVATSFYENLVQLGKHSNEACFEFISKGEAGPLVVSLMQDPAFTPQLQAQVIAVFEAIADGRKSARAYPQPRKSDYDALAADLSRRGWSQADLQLFSDEHALANAGPAKVCQMVRDWFAAQLALKDPDMQVRLLVESLKPIVAG